MNYVDLINKYFKNKKVKECFLHQLSLYNQIKENVVINNKYNIGDKVFLNRGTLLHGTKVDVDNLSIIKENGILAVEFYDKQYPNQKKPYTAEFWDIKDDILLYDYLNKYTESTLIFKTKNGNIKKYVNLSNIKKEVINMKNEDYANWEIYQTKEARFLPNIYNNINFAFIINTDNTLIKSLISNNIQNNEFSEIIKKKILPKWFYNKNVKNGFHNYDEFETDREIAVLFGIPSNIIEGIIVNKNIENDECLLAKINDVFPNVYICNIEGIVIKLKKSII